MTTKKTHSINITIEYAGGEATVTTNNPKGTITFPNTPKGMTELVVYLGALGTAHALIAQGKTNPDEADAFMSEMQVDLKASTSDTNSPYQRLRLRSSKTEPVA